MNEPSAAAGSTQGPVLITGATGRIGRCLVAALAGAEPHTAVAVLTRAPQAVKELWPDTPIDYRYGDLTDPASLAPALEGIDVVFHLASYSPNANEPDPYASPAHWAVSAEGTRNLVDAAIACDVRRLVYLSTVKAMGSQAGTNGHPADESTPARPDTVYGQAKLAAEKTILKAGEEGGMHVSILRLPMVYGLDGGGNLGRMIDAVARGRFPPWPRVENRRSAVHVADVIRAARLVSMDSRANGEIYLVTDGYEYSTRWLYEQIHAAIDGPPPNWSVPLWCLRLAAKLGSKGERLSGRAMPLTTDTLGKLIDNAWYSSWKIQKDLSFIPSYRLDTEIPAMVRAYLARTGRAKPGNGQGDAR